MERYQDLDISKEYIVISGYSLKNPEKSNSFLFASIDMREICSVNAEKFVDIKKIRTGERFTVKISADKFELRPIVENSNTFRRRSNICWEIQESVYSYHNAKHDLYLLYDKNSEFYSVENQCSLEQEREKEKELDKKASRLQNEKENSINYMYWLVKALTNISNDFSFCSSTREYVYGKIMNQINYHANNILHPKKYSLITSVNQINDLVSELNVKVYIPEVTANRLIDNFEAEEAESFVDPQRKIEDFFPSTNSASKI